jgi:hypothetical protein
MAHDKTNSAGEFLALLVPGNVLEELRRVSVTYQREEAVRVYAARRLWFVIPMGFLFAVVSGAGALGVSLFILDTFDPPRESWIRGAAFLLALFIWLGAMILQLLALFSWLANRALRAAPNLGSVENRALQPTRHGVAWSLLLVAIFIVLPLLMLAAVSPTVALVLVGLAILAPVLVTILDR